MVGLCVAYTVELMHVELHLVSGDVFLRLCIM